MSRRRRSHRGPTDSLDLLLGPMCNTFGGIVLMAVVMALLSREVDVSAEAQARGTAAGDTAEIMARRVSKAEDDLARAEAFRVSLDERSRDPSLAERVKLAAERQRLRRQLDALRLAPRGKPSRDANADPGVLANDLHAELGALVRRKVEEENARASLEENLARLERRQSELAAQTQNEKDKAVRKLRLPKERALTKTPFFVILRYGRVYPRAVFVNGVREENSLTIKRTATGDELLLEPRAGQGLDPAADGAALATLLRSIPAGSYYIAFIVYEDSFATFNLVKPQLAGAGLDYGWHAFTRDRPLIYSKDGRAAAPPL